jgi:hypothetical protein
VVSTWAELLERLRVDLRDPDEERWTDDVLARHLERANLAVSLAAPRQMTTTLATTAGSRELDLSEEEELQELVRIEAVEWPAGRYPREFVRFQHWDQLLTLLVDHPPQAVEDVIVYWGAVHPFDIEETEPVTLPVDAIEVLLLGAAGYAAVEWAGFAINRANIAGGRAVGDYRRWGEDRLAEFQKGLQRLRSALRLRRMYTADAATLGKNIVSFQ